MLSFFVANFIRKEVIVMAIKKRIPEGSVRRTKVVKVGTVKATAVLQKKRRTALEKLKAKRAYMANKAKIKAARKRAAAKRTPKQKMDAAIRRAISKAVREGKSPYQAATKAKAAFLARRSKA